MRDSYKDCENEVCDYQVRLLLMVVITCKLQLTGLTDECSSLDAVDIKDNHQNN